MRNPMPSITTNQKQKECSQPDSIYRMETKETAQRAEMKRKDDGGSHPTNTTRSSSHGKN